MTINLEYFLKYNRQTRLLSFGTERSETDALASRRRSHGLGDALRFSSNTFFYQVGVGAGSLALKKAATQLGFGRKTGIEIGWEENIGLVGDETWAAAGRGSGSASERRKAFVAGKYSSVVVAMSCGAVWPCGISCRPSPAGGCVPSRVE